MTTNIHLIYYIFDPLAQAVEHLTFNQGVPGSIPGWITKFIYASVAQLDRAIASDAMCRAFESHRAYQKKLTRD